MGGGVSISLMMQDSSLPNQPNGWVTDSLDFTRSITFRQAYERYVMGATLPPEVQYQRYYDATAAIFLREGYTDKETKWWFLRTGQGPKCYRQYTVGNLCGMPPYDVWFNWYFKKQPDPYSGIGCAAIWADRRNNDCYMMAAFPMYPPPGYRMPGIPCNTAGKRFNYETDPRALSGEWFNMRVLGGSGPWIFSDLPEMWGDPASMGFGAAAGGYMAAFDATGIIGAGFCSNLEVDESAGMLHPVPLAYTVFYATSFQQQLQNSIAMGEPFSMTVRGLPIGIMALLDKLSNKQWPTFFDSKLQTYLWYGDGTNYADLGIRNRAWPLALRDTLQHFNITDAGLWRFQQKIDDICIKLAPKKRKRGATFLMAGGDFGMYVTLICMAVCTAGIASAAAALIVEAVVAAGIAEAAAAAQAIKTAQTVQTAYNVIKAVQSDNPNLLSIGSGLLSLSGVTADLGLTEAGEGLAYDYSMDGFEPIAVGGEQMAFDYTGDNLMPLDLTEGSDLLGGMTTDALNSIDPDVDYSNVDFGGPAAEQLQAGIDNIVANLDQYAGDANALLTAIEEVATEVATTNAELALAVIDKTEAIAIETAMDDAMADNTDIAATTDVGPLTVDQLDMAALDEGWTVEETTGQNYEEAAAEGAEQQLEAQQMSAEVTIEEVQQLAEVAVKIAQAVEPLVVAPPPPPPPPPAPAPIVPAPAPSQPVPGPVATMQPTAIPDSITALVPDGYTDIPLTTASFGPVAPDGEKGFNLWWLLPLGLLAIPLGDKKRRRKGRR